jgi:hypothetical protein
MLALFASISPVLEALSRLRAKWIFPLLGSLLVKNVLVEKFGFGSFTDQLFLMLNWDEFFGACPALEDR